MGSLTVKEVLCVLYSVLLFVSGIVLISLSAILAIKLFNQFKFVPSGSVGPFIVIFILGFIHLFLTWLGVKGPSREHDFHIYMFMILTLILLCGEFAIGVWSMVLRGQVENESGKLLTESFDEMIKIDYNKKEWVRLQIDLKCCGLHGSQDYAIKDSYPKACTDYQVSNGTFQVLYENGCNKALVKHVKKIMLYGALLGFLSSLYQAVGLFIFYLFVKELKNVRSKRIARRLQMDREAAAAVHPPGPQSSPPPVSTSQ
ncbi:unnamed protein product [Brassicogethes aeneus]|uniref:Tetraspanin n=1 Tax=Brassicogethes aeneus TaxID=1431903 RepID=A0A9P0B3D0_BRAAE|nr:unnamed protein product [Brassicogethes aeneus]